MNEEKSNFVFIDQGGTTWRLASRCSWRQKCFFWLLGKLFDFDISYEVEK